MPGRDYAGSFILDLLRGIMEERDRNLGIIDPKNFLDYDEARADWNEEVVDVVRNILRQADGG